MTRGNQRDINRERARKRAEKAGYNPGKKDDEGTNFKNKMEQDAEIMRQKQKAAEEKRKLEQQQAQKA